MPPQAQWGPEGKPVAKAYLGCAVCADLRNETALRGVRPACAVAAATVKAIRHHGLIVMRSALQAAPASGNVSKVYPIPVPPSRIDDPSCSM